MKLSLIGSAAVVLFLAGLAAEPAALAAGPQGSMAAQPSRMPRTAAFIQGVKRQAAKVKVAAQNVRTWVRDARDARTGTWTPRGGKGIWVGHVPARAGSVRTVEHVEVVDGVPVVVQTPAPRASRVVVHGDVINGDKISQHDVDTDSVHTGSSTPSSAPRRTVRIGHDVYTQEDEGSVINVQDHFGDNIRIGDTSHESPRPQGGQPPRAGSRAPRSTFNIDKVNGDIVDIQGNVASVTNGQGTSSYDFGTQGGNVSINGKPFSNVRLMFKHRDGLKTLIHMDGTKTELHPDGRQVRLDIRGNEIH